MAGRKPAEGSYRSNIIQGRVTGHEHAGNNRASRVFIPSGRSGEADRRLGRISHNGSPGNAAVAMASGCQRGALILARAADPGAVG